VEREGLVEPRAGHGTFVLRRPPGPPPGTHARLARSLAQWVRGAREAELDDDSIESLLRITLQTSDGAEIA
jgi:GntR family transcriptional regulator